MANVNRSPVRALRATVVAGLVLAAAACGTTTGGDGGAADLQAVLLTSDDVGLPSVDERTDADGHGEIDVFVDPDGYVERAPDDLTVWPIEDDETVAEPLAQGREAAELLVDHRWGRADVDGCWEEGGPPQVAAAAGATFAEDDAFVTEVVVRYRSTREAEEAFDGSARLAFHAEDRGLVVSEGGGASDPPAADGPGVLDCGGIHGAGSTQQRPCERLDGCRLLRPVEGSGPWTAVALADDRVVTVIGSTDDDPTAMVQKALDRLA